MRMCIGCKKAKPISEFYLRKGAGEIYSYCKSCNSERQRIYRKNNKDKYKASNKRNNDTDKHREACREWNKKNKDKVNFNVKFCRVSKTAKLKFNRELTEDEKNIIKNGIREGLKPKQIIQRIESKTRLKKLFGNYDNLYSHGH